MYMLVLGDVGAAHSVHLLGALGSATYEAATACGDSCDAPTAYCTTNSQATTTHSAVQGLDAVVLIAPGCANDTWRISWYRPDLDCSYEIDMDSAVGGPAESPDALAALLGGIANNLVPLAPNS
jgi:hypothetical protein